MPKMKWISAAAALLLSSGLGAPSLDLPANLSLRPSFAAPGDPCPGGVLDPGAGEDIVLSASCSVGAGTYHYGVVNIINGGSLNFQDKVIHFWAQSVVVENGGSLIAGSTSTPIGQNGGLVTIHLYGADQGPGGTGVACK